MKLKKFAGLSLAFTLGASTLAAQDFYSLIGTAESLYSAKDYLQSAQKYEEAFKVRKGQRGDYYNAACSWAKAGKTEEAFKNLNQAIDKGWKNLSHLKNDEDLNLLHSDKRWRQLLDKLEVLVEKYEASLNKPLKRELEQIQIEDQKYRLMIDSVQKNFGMKSVQLESLWAVINRRDEKNRKRVIEIVDQYGWPGKSLVGETGNLAAFLVIQHSDLKTQGKYLPLFREAVKKGEADAGQLALLEDRVLVGNGKKQIYGTQLRTNYETGETTLYEIEDEKNVDKRRAEVGLPPLAQYVKRFGIEYQPKTKPKEEK
jgi:tetratricopeptide (TPR) repeat protein